MFVDSPIRPTRRGWLVKRTAVRAAIIAAIVPFLPVLGQANPNVGPHATSSAAVSMSSAYTENDATCPAPSLTFGPTPLDPVTSATSCPLSSAMASVLSDYSAAPYTVGTSTLNGGAAQLLSSAAATANFSWSASASLVGTVAPQVFARSDAHSDTYEYIRVSDPASIFMIAVSASAQVSASGPQSFVMSAADLSAYSVDPSSGLFAAYVAESYSPDDGTGVQHVDCLGVDCTDPTGLADLHVELPGSIINSNGIFAALVRADAYVIADNGAGTDDLPVDFTASAGISAFDVRVYGRDAGGNLYDATREHTISFDPGSPVTATPEPATMMLTATGLVSIVGTLRRKRQIRA